MNSSQLLINVGFFVLKVDLTKEKKFLVYSSIYQK